MTTPEWLTYFRDQINSHIHRGDYLGALKIARSELKRHPASVDVQFSYAKVLGDWADLLPPARKSKFKRESALMLRKIVRRLAGQPKEFRFSVSLNLYYQTENFRGMHRYGKKLAAQGDRQGWYAQGVALTHLAENAWLKGDSRSSHRWASQSCEAWRRYKTARATYYFPHYCFALSLVLNGQKVQAMRALKTAAKVSQRTIRDAEFANVVKLLEDSSVT